MFMLAREEKYYMYMRGVVCGDELPSTNSAVPLHYSLFQLICSDHIFTVQVHSHCSYCSHLQQAGVFSKKSSDKVTVHDLLFTNSSQTEQL